MNLWVSKVVNVDKKDAVKSGLGNVRPAKSLSVARERFLCPPNICLVC